MKSLKIFSITLLAAATLLTAGCKKEEILSFGGQMDQFTVTDEDGQKTYLGHAEKWIYWESGDDIKAYVDGATSKCNLVSGSGTLEAFFRSESTLAEDRPVYAIYPYSSGEGATFSGNTCNGLVFPAVHPYREAGTPTDPDSSFGRGAMPMVAWETNGTDHEIFFHVVAGILRIQIFSSEYKIIDEITFVEDGAANGSSNKQISGPFTVNDVQYNMPWLVGTSVTDANRTIKITGINKQVGPDKLLTFYLPLPAVGEGGSGTPNTVAANSYTHYILKMTVKTTDNKYFTRTLGADIHRRNITMMRALQVTSWSEAGGVGTSNVQLVGSGTKDRPFQIYTGKELEQLRDVYIYDGTINGQPIHGMSDSEEPTYIKIVRSDIELLNSTDYNNLSDAEQQNPSSRFANWTRGIPNFRGYMYFASSTATNGGITNRSDHPLFESIATDGYVYRVYVKSKQRDVATDVAVTPTVVAGGSFSPMCNVNSGTMNECHNKCKVSVSGNVNLAGLCVTNNGTIIAGANEAELTTEGNVAGVCFNNNGTIQGNFTISAAVPQGNNIAGIAFNNNNGASVKDCQVSSNSSVTSTGNWGVVVFDNKSGAEIDNCTSTGTVVYTIEGSVGGICNINSGTVKNCTNNVEIRASQGNVGGIVATMDNADAVVYNCCTRTPFLYGAIDNSRVATNIGGIAGQLLKGKIYNCYNASRVTGATNSGGMIGNLANDVDVDVQNSWSAQGQGFVGLYDDGAHVGVFCFSATIAATYCNLIYNASSAPSSNDVYKIREMRTNQDQSLGGDVDPSALVGQHCGVALNAWVTKHQNENGRVYLNWVQTEGAVPIFYEEIPIVGKKSYRRR